MIATACLPAQIAELPIERILLIVREFKRGGRLRWLERTILNLLRKSGTGNVRADDKILALATIPNGVL